MHRPLKVLILIAAAASAGAGVLWVKYDDWIRIPRARQPVRDLMKDPDSTKFRAESLESDGWLCGELNSKNEYGAYVGFKKFMSNKKGGKIFLQDMSLNEISAKGSTEDFLVRLTKETKILQRENESRENGGPIIRFSQRERDAIVAQEIFDDKWRDNCRSSTLPER